MSEKKTKNLLSLKNAFLPAHEYMELVFHSKSVKEAI